MRAAVMRNISLADRVTAMRHVTNMKTAALTITVCADVSAFS